MASGTSNPSEPGPATSAWEVARQAGLDMDLLEDCLAVPPEERLRLHAIALETAERLRRAMRERHDAPALDPRTTPGE